MLALLGLPSVRCTLAAGLFVKRGNGLLLGCCDDLLDGLSDSLGVGVDGGRDTVSEGEKHPTMRVSRTVAILLVNNFLKFCTASQLNVAIILSLAWCTRLTRFGMLQLGVKPVCAQKTK